jgi:glutamate dehydrogenase (NAD(P)+)
LSAVEAATGKRFSLEEQQNFAQGADELTLVRSGLEETMATAYQQIRETWLKLDGQADLRTAALVGAINKIAVCYQEMGLFP